MYIKAYNDVLHVPVFLNDTYICIMVHTYNILRKLMISVQNIYLCIDADTDENIFVEKDKLYGVVVRHMDKNNNIFLLFLLI
jgi:hypothetical protein